MEQIRTALSKRPYFNARTAFDFCSRSRQGMIYTNDLREVLANTGFYATDREI
jgi:Ca2+-binding EF-hand superfamily protein